jgi:hypothetical protein
VPGDRIVRGPAGLIVLTSTGPIVRAPADRIALTPTGPTGPVLAGATVRAPIDRNGRLLGRIVPVPTGPPPVNVRRTRSAGKRARISVLDRIKRNVRRNVPGSNTARDPTGKRLVLVREAARDRTNALSREGARRQQRLENERQANAQRVGPTP